MSVIADQNVLYLRGVKVFCNPLIDSRTGFEAVGVKVRVLFLMVVVHLTPV